MKIKKRIIASIFVLVFFSSFFCLPKTSARENVNYWYIQNFEAEIAVNKDSSLDITERITADCGNAVDKHGIFRIVPDVLNVSGQKIKTPVKLLAITDFNGHSIKYTESRNRSDGTVTWKIGDPNKTVQGLNYYLIHYQVRNAIRFSNPNFDEFYWNLSGNFWDLEIDNFRAVVTFPSEVNENNRTLDLYSGDLGAKGNNLAASQWSAPDVLEVNSIKTLFPGQGITASVTFPKNIFTPYVPSFWEKYGPYFSFLIPLIALIGCFSLWRKYGKDPRVDKTIIPEYDIPGNLSPIEMGMLMNNGRFNNKFITAEIINLATKKLISIKETDNKILFFHSRDYELTKNANPAVEAQLNSSQAAILNSIFQGLGGTSLSSLKNNFYKFIPEIKKNAKTLLENKQLIVASGLMWQIIFLVAGFIIFFPAFMTFSISPFLGGSFFISGLIILIFSFIMPKRTPAGAELNWQIKGFKLFMETVDKDRAKFYEKENIFEKFLPYAIIFGITKLWIAKMKEIYGEDFYAHYAPVWYAGNLAAFDADSFSTAIDNLSSSIASNTSSPSGAGGAGGAGGGGGGGGGGGW